MKKWQLGPKNVITQIHQSLYTFISTLGVPPWTETDLRHCLDDSLALSPETLLKIHVAIDAFSRTINVRFSPTPAMLSLAHKVTDQRIKAKSRYDFT